MAARPGRIAKLEARVGELEEELKRARGVTAALCEVGMAVGTAPEIDHLLELILNKITAVLEAERATLFLLEAKVLVSRIMQGGKARTIELPVGQGIAGRVARTGRPVRVADAYEDDRFDPSWDKRTGYRTRSILAVPLKSHAGKTIGVVQVLNKIGPGDRPTEFTRHDAELLSAFTAQVAVSLEKDRLFREQFRQTQQLMVTKDRLERSLRDLEFLYHLEVGMSRADTLEELARSVVRLTADACQAAAGGLLVETAAESTLYLLSLAKPTRVRAVVVQAGEGIAARALAARELIVASQARQVRDPKRVRELLGVPVRSAIAAPLVVEGEHVSGALVLYHRKGHAPRFDEGNVSLIKLVSANVSTELRLFRAREDRVRQQRLTSIGRLLSGVMHDLRTPLTVISGYMQLMQVADDPELRAEYGQTIREQFEVIAAMQGDLLAYARGETSLLIRKVYLTGFFEEVARNLGSELERANVALDMQLEERGTAHFDEGKLARAVHNLARNAIEAMEASKGGGTLTIRCRSDGEDLQIRVCDTGRGIPKTIRKKLFDPFVTAGKSTGTGLGLSIVKRIVEEHGGSVGVESSPRGTCFTITLPQATGPMSRRGRGTNG